MQDVEDAIAKAEKNLAKAKRRSKMLTRVLEYLQNSSNGLDLKKWKR
jgi:hypothetical protein